MDSLFREKAILFGFNHVLGLLLLKRDNAVPK